MLIHDFVQWSYTFVADHIIIIAFGLFILYGSLFGVIEIDKRKHEDYKSGVWDDDRKDKIVFVGSADRTKYESGPTNLLKSEIWNYLKFVDLETDSDQVGLNPSSEKDSYYLDSMRKLGYGYYPSPLPPFFGGRSGKWLIFVHVDNIDEVWAKIKKATENGLLGGHSKVSTIRPNSISSKKSTHVICVYTYDWTDKIDVMRIRDMLHEIGIKGRIPYKTDEDTIKGKYYTNGNTKVSKYYQ